MRLDVGAASLPSSSDRPRGAPIVIGSSQSRVAKMEAADATVSFDLLIRGLLALGATTETSDA